MSRPPFAPRPRPIVLSANVPSPSFATSARKAVNIHPAFSTVRFGRSARWSARTRGRLLMTRCDHPFGAVVPTTVPGAISAGGRGVRS